MAIAQLANTARTGKRPGAAKNKGTTKKAHKNKSATKKAQNKTPVRATLSSAAIKEVRNSARKELLADLKTKGALVEQNKRKTKKHHKKRKNGGTGLMSYLPSLPNPNFRGIGNTLVTGAAIVGGGGVSTVLAALLLAGADWILPASWTQNTWYQRYGQAVATFVAAVFVLPLVLTVRVFNFIPNAAKTAATWGGVGFGLGQAYNELTGTNVFSPNFGDELTSGVRNLFPSTGNKDADNAAKAVLQAGGSQQQAAAAAATTLRGLRGRGNGGGMDYSRTRPPMMQVRRAF